MVERRSLVGTEQSWTGLGSAQGPTGHQAASATVSPPDTKADARLIRAPCARSCQLLGLDYQPQGPQGNRKLGGEGSQEPRCRRPEQATLQTPPNPRGEQTPWAAHLVCGQGGPSADRASHPGGGPSQEKAPDSGFRWRTPPSALR